jgi:hypothetical protein
MHVGVVANVHTTTGGSVTYKIENETDSAVDLVASRNFPASDTAEEIDGETSPALANREFDRNDILLLTLTSPATSGLNDYTVVVTFFSKGHVTDDATYD